MRPRAPRTRLRDALCRCRPGPRAAPSAAPRRGREAETVQAFAANLRAHAGKPTQIAAISIDMSPAFIKGVEANFSNAQITFDKFHVIAHASAAIDACCAAPSRSSTRASRGCVGRR
ncbi:MAG: transposase [Steroidobacteraceae bacterium]